MLIKQEQRSFEGWRDSLETVPTIKALRAKVESIRASEFEKAVHKLGDGVNKKQLRAVEELSKVRRGAGRGESEREERERERGGAGRAQSCAPRCARAPAAAARAALRCRASWPPCLDASLA